jgi:hypothetical protein
MYICIYILYRKLKESKSEKVEAVEAPPQRFRRESEKIKSLGGGLHRLRLLYYILIVRRLLLFIPYHL